MWSRNRQRWAWILGVFLHRSRADQQLRYHTRCQMKPSPLLFGKTFRAYCRYHVARDAIASYLVSPLNTPRSAGCSQYAAGALQILSATLLSIPNIGIDRWMGRKLRILTLIPESQHCCASSSATLGSCCLSLCGGVIISCWPIHYVPRLNRKSMLETIQPIFNIKWKSNSLRPCSIWYVNVLLTILLMLTHYSVD